MLVGVFPLAGRAYEIGIALPRGNQPAVRGSSQLGQTTLLLVARSFSSSNAQYFAEMVSCAVGAGCDSRDLPQPTSNVTATTVPHRLMSSMERPFGARVTNARLLALPHHRMRARALPELGLRWLPLLNAAIPEVAAASTATNTAAEAEVVHDETAATDEKYTGGDLNPYALRRRNLNPLRMPISPPVWEIAGAGGRGNSVTAHVYKISGPRARGAANAAGDRWRTCVAPPGRRCRITVG